MSDSVILIKSTISTLISIVKEPLMYVATFYGLGGTFTNCLIKSKFVLAVGVRRAA